MVHYDETSKSGMWRSAGASLLVPMLVVQDFALFCHLLNSHLSLFTPGNTHSIS